MVKEQRGGTIGIDPLKQRGTAEHLGGTRVKFTCAYGHTFTVDYSKVKRSKRIGEAGVKLMVNWWNKGGVNVGCPKCSGRK